MAYSKVIYESLLKKTRKFSMKIEITLLMCHQMLNAIPCEKL